MAQSDLADLVSEAKCYFCLDDKQATAVLLYLLVRLNEILDPMATSNLTELVDQAKCYFCLDEKQAGAVMLERLTSLVEIFGTTGSVGFVTCGDVDPVADPGTGCGLYVNRTNSSLWYWDSVLGIWVALIV